MLKGIQAVILAGGKGTRLGSLGKKIPKAMVNINGTPFVDILINQLKKNKVIKCLLLTGYKKEQLINYYKNSKNVLTIKGNNNWQTLTRIKKVKRLIKSKFFLLMYCDNFLINFKLKKLLKLKKKHNSKIFFSVVKKKSGQKSTVILNKNRLIYKKSHNSELVEAGYMLVKKDFFFNNIKNYNGNKLSDYLRFLSKKNTFSGHYYGDKFLCIENKKFVLEAKQYFLKK